MIIDSECAGGGEGGQEGRNLNGVEVLNLQWVMSQLWWMEDVGEGMEPCMSNYAWQWDLAFSEECEKK